MFGCAVFHIFSFTARSPRLKLSEFCSEGAFIGRYAAVQV
jgi:hypothetical protein